MPAIELINGTELTVSSRETTPTLLHYLQNGLVFGFELVKFRLKAFNGASTTVGELDENDFPLTLSAKPPGGSFNVNGATLGVKGGGSASVDLLKNDKKQDFLSSLKLDSTSTPDLMGFAFSGQVEIGPALPVGDFSFGLTTQNSITVTNYAPVQATNTFKDALETAISATTIPHDLNDLRDLPTGHFCRLEGKGSLAFTASVQYSIFNNVLATQPLEVISKDLTVSAQADATLEVDVVHSDAHRLTIAAVGNNKIRLGAGLTHTADTTESLSVSVGISGALGSKDALAFLVQHLTPKAEQEMKKIRQEMPPDQQADLSAQIKDVLQKATQGGVTASLSEALEQTKTRNHLFVFDVDLNALDETSTPAVEAALHGDFRQLTRGGSLAGITEVANITSLTVEKDHGLTIHLLGILNFGDVSSFIRQCKSAAHNKDTGDIILSATEIKVAQNSIDPDHVREVLLISAMITSSALSSPQNPDFAFKMTFFLSKARSSPSDLIQFTNALRAVSSADADRATQLLSNGAKSFTDLAIYLSFELNKALSLRVFEGRTTDDYVRAGQRALRTILTGDSASASRMQLSQVPIEFWNQLREQGARPNILALLSQKGITDQAVVVDFFAIDWWAQAMAEVAAALANHAPLEKAQKEALKDSQGGFDLPWALLATRELAGSPAVLSKFSAPSTPAVRTLTATGS